MYHLLTCRPNMFLCAVISPQLAQAAARARQSTKAHLVRKARVQGSCVDVQ